MYVIWLCIIMMPAKIMADSENVSPPDLEISVKDSDLVLNGKLGFELSESALEALSNGLPLTFETEINVVPENSWFWSRPVVSEHFMLEIKYHALSQHYLVKAMNSRYARSLLTRSSALEALKEVSDLHLVQLLILDPDKQYRINIHTALDSRSLPVPLRPLIYLTDDWQVTRGNSSILWPKTS